MGSFNLELRRMLHFLLNKLCCRSRVLHGARRCSTQTRLAAGGCGSEGGVNTQPDQKRRREEPEEAQTHPLAAKEETMAIFKDQEILMKIAEGIEQVKQKMMKDCHNLLYSLMNEDGTTGSLVCVVHKYAALTHCHGKQTQALKEGDKVLLRRWDGKKSIRAKVVEHQPFTVVDEEGNEKKERGRDYVYFEIEEPLVYTSPQQFDYNKLYPGMPINVIGLFLKKPCVVSFDNVYSDVASTLGHYDGASPSFMGESEALIVSNTGEIVGINVGGYKPDKDIKTASHRRFVPIKWFKDRLNDLNRRDDGMNIPE